MKTITKKDLLKKVNLLRFENEKSLETLDFSSEVYAQEEAIRDTFDLIEIMINEL